MSDTASPKVRIRAERPFDHDSIARVVEAAFGSPDEPWLVDRIRSSEYYVPSWSLVATTRDHVVGHVMVSYAMLQNGEDRHRVACLSPLAVAPGHQDGGVGTSLVREVTARVDADGEPLVVLQGSPRFYGRLGFEYSVPCGIDVTLPSWAPPTAAQVLRLSAYDASIRGRLVLPAAFALVSDH